MIQLTADEYLGHSFMTTDHVLDVPNATRNPGHRFEIRVFATPEKLQAWHCRTADTIRHYHPTAVGSLSALPAVIALHPVRQEPEITIIRVGEVLETSEGSFTIEEIPYHNPFLVPIG